MIDTHTHLYHSSFPDGGKEVVMRALEAGVKHMVLPNTDKESIQPILDLHKAFPKATSIAMGLHPTDLDENWEETLDMMEKLLEENKDFVAVGEVGIDLYWDKSNLENQKRAFARQLKIASRLNLPVIIHCREALDETISVIKEVNPAVPLIFHSFTGGIKEVEKIRNVCDPWFGINGVVTYKNAENLREALPVIGLERIVLETDSPYLTPVPHRGKKNESAYLPYILSQVAKSLGKGEDEVEKITEDNAVKIFNIS